MTQPLKTDRLHNETISPLKKNDHRIPSQKDRDRLLFCSAFRRLAGVTQVVSAQEGHIFHNRLTHSLKVAQIGRSLADKILQSQQQLANQLGGIDPNVVETAALAHDLGHPPFGHIAERKLHQLALASGLKDGFEGNAQSFRIVTKLAVRKAEFYGLNLTRASLNAILKYPWLYGQNHEKSTRKWGAFFTEKEDFEFARAMHPESRAKSIEAELMDWADDIAYSIHDVEDFYRANLIPLDRLVGSLYQTRNGNWKVIEGSELDRFFTSLFKRWEDEEHQGDYRKPEIQEKLRQAFIGIISQLTEIKTPYDGLHFQKAYIHNFTSGHVSKYIQAIKLLEPDDTEDIVTIDQECLYEVKMLKELTWHYVMIRPALAAQKHGQVHMIEKLFEIFHDAVQSSKRGDWDIFPISYQEKLETIDDTQERARTAIDLIASMTEAQMVAMYQRLMGTSNDSMLIPIVQ